VVFEIGGYDVGLWWQPSLQEVIVNVLVVRVVSMYLEELRVFVMVIGHVVTVV
jgi:hypothetical protein